MADYLQRPPDEETALAVRARSDRQAFGALFDLTLPRIYGFLYRRLGHKETAEDLTSRTFEKALASIQRFDPDRGSWNSWIYRIATNVMFDHFRSARPESPLPEDDQHEPGVPERITTVLDLQFDRRKLLLAMKALPERYQLAISLRFFEDRTTEEMMDILEVRRGTLAVLLHRSLKAMEKVMRDRP